MTKFIAKAAVGFGMPILSTPQLLLRVQDKGDYRRFYDWKTGFSVQVLRGNS